MNPKANHTALGKYNARKTLEDEHRDDHHDGHHDARCKLCVEAYFDAKAKQAGY